jgi:dephospho-CoA kinase
MNLGLDNVKEYDDDIARVRKLMDERARRYHEHEEKQKIVTEICNFIGTITADDARKVKEVVFNYQKLFDKINQEQDEIKEAEEEQRRIAEYKKMAVRQRITALHEAGIDPMELLAYCQEDDY